MIKTCFTSTCYINETGSKTFFNPRRIFSEVIYAYYTTLTSPISNGT